MEENESKGLLQKLGISVDGLVNNRVVEFFLERYVNWTTESQRMFRRFSLVFISLIFVSVVALVYLTTFDQHQKIHSYDSIYRLLQKYGLNKAITDEQIASLQAGRGGIAKGFGEPRINQISGQIGLPAGQMRVTALPPESQEGILNKGFEVIVNKMTYPQLAQFMYFIETSGKNIHVANLKIMKRADANGYYQMNVKLSVVEPVFEDVQ